MPCEDLMASACTAQHSAGATLLSSCTQPIWTCCSLAAQYRSHEVQPAAGELGVLANIRAAVQSDVMTAYQVPILCAHLHAQEIAAA